MPYETPTHILIYTHRLYEFLHICQTLAVDVILECLRKKILSARGTEKKNRNYSERKNQKKVN